MTIVFVTAIIIASYRFNRFLFLIAFLSYYSVFAGVRKLRLKNLHKDQKPKWFDWTAGILNGIANLFFIGLGIYYSIMGILLFLSPYVSKFFTRYSVKKAISITIIINLVSPVIIYI